MRKRVLSVSRRKVGAALALSLLACVLGCAASAHSEVRSDASPKRGPVVIVPGTGAGAGAYERLRTALQKRGRTAYALSLAGMGERVSDLAPGIDANTHAQEIADFLITHDLHDVTLIGHSYGGMPMTGALGRSQGRVSHLVYVDSYVPKNGDSLFSLDPVFAKMIQEKVDKLGDGWKIPPFAGKQFFSDEAGIAWFEAHETASPLAMYKSPLVVDDAALAKVAKGYVAYQQYKFFQHQGEALQRAGGKYRTVNARHMGVYTDPDATAEAILAVE